MATFSRVMRRDRDVIVVLLRVGIVTLTLATAAIHWSLGGLLFTINAVGYTTLALLMVVPGPVGRVRWPVRLALFGFAAATIGGWLMFGARFQLAYIDKAIEVALMAFLAAELWVVDGGPREVVRRLLRLATAASAAISRRRPA